MTREMEYLAYLYACGSRGVQAQPPDYPVNWLRLFQIAAEQSIFHTVAVAVRQNELGCPDDIKRSTVPYLRRDGLKNVLTTDGILDLVGEMEARGIPVLIIKGIDVARCYANPECRISSDTDLLIRPQDEEKAYELLTESGFQMKKRREESNHGIGHHPTFGQVELHIKLLADFYQNVKIKDWQLDDRAMRFREKQEYLGKTYYAMEPTDNLLFLTHHMLKHFMYDGLGLRMMMDNTLYAIQHSEQIDRERYARSLLDTNFYHVMQVIFGAMVKYCGFCREDFPIEPSRDDEQIDLIMTDLEESGVQGLKNESERVEAWHYYRCKTMHDTNDREQLSAIKKDIRTEYGRSLFPTVEHLSIKYPRLRRHKWQYPFCWTHRFVTRGVKTFFFTNTRAETDVTKLSEGGQKKAALFRSLGLMP